MKEWYLTDNYMPNLTSGYESDAISEYAENNFADVLATTFSDIVTLYNSDMSESKVVRCVIQGNIADTQVGSAKRTVLFPIGTSKAGMYVEFKDSIWLITGYPGNNKAYEKATLELCQFKLKWQNAKCEIIERWGNFTSASKYDDGTTNTLSIILTSDNLTVLLPSDDETLYLMDKRVFIDLKPIPEKVYSLTRVDDVLFNYGSHGGIISFIADKTELNPYTDNQELGICDYVAVPPNDDDDSSGGDTPAEDVIGIIEGSSTIKVGKKRTYTATLKNTDETEIPWSDNYTWNIVCDYNVKFTHDGNTAEILADKTDYVGGIITLQIMDVGASEVIAEKAITITDIY